MCYENYGNCYQPPILGPAFRPAPRFGYQQPPVPVFGRPLFPSPYAAGHMNGYYNGFNDGNNLTAFFGFTAGTLIGDWLRNRGQQPCQQQAQPCQQQAQACQEQPGTGYNQAPAGQSQVYPPASVRTVEPPRIQAPAAPAQGANGEGDKNIYQQLMAKIAEQTARIDELMKRLGQQGCSDKPADKTAPAKHKVHKAKAKPVEPSPCTESPKPEVSTTATADEKNSCDPSDPFFINGRNKCGDDPSDAITSNLCHRTNDQDKNYSDPNDAPYLPDNFTPAGGAKSDELNDKPSETPTRTSTLPEDWNHYHRNFSFSSDDDSADGAN
jgi:hypothetical protein